MNGRMYRRCLSAATASVVVIGAVSAQTVTLKRRGSGGVTVTTQGQQVLLTTRVTNADTRTVFQEIAAKSGARILLSPAVSGALTSSVDNQPFETGLRTVASSAGLVVSKILVPEAAAASMKPATAASLAGTLSVSLTAATVVDPASGRSVTLSYAATAPKPAADQAVVYYLSRAPKAGSASAVQDAVAAASESLSGLTTEQRFQAMRDLQRQTFQSMTPEEREKMRQQGPGGPGGPGGFGGPPPGGFGGPPNGGEDGGGPPPPPE